MLFRSQATAGINASIIKPVILTLFDAHENLGRPACDVAAMDLQIHDQQMRSVRCEGVAAEKPAFVVRSLVTACHRIKRLVKPPFNIDPPEPLRAIAPQWGLSKDIAGLNRAFNLTGGDGGGRHL